MIYILRDFDEMLAAGVDDCGLPFELCPGPPRPRPWGEGRPCTRDRSGTLMAAGSSIRMARPPSIERAIGSLSGEAT